LKCTLLCLMTRIRIHLSQTSKTNGLLIYQLLPFITFNVSFNSIIIFLYFQLISKRQFLNLSKTLKINIVKKLRIDIQLFSEIVLFLFQTIISSFLRPISFHLKLSKLLNITKSFLKNNIDLIILRMNKRNITVAINKQDKNKMIKCWVILIFTC